MRYTAQLTLITPQDLAREGAVRSGLFPGLPRCILIDTNKEERSELQLGNSTTVPRDGVRERLPPRTPDRKKEEQDALNS